MPEPFPSVPPQAPATVSGQPGGYVLRAPQPVLPREALSSQHCLLSGPPGTAGFPDGGQRRTSQPGGAAVLGAPPVIRASPARQITTL